MSTANIIFNTSTLIYGMPVDYRPLVSFVIPTYKRLRFLREAIESVISQHACSPYELIIVDNDQALNILDVVSSFSPSKVAVYQNSNNIGMWGNINLGLNLAKGEWILILCDDDMLMPNALRSFEKIVSSHHKDKDIGCLAGGVVLMSTRETQTIFKFQQPYFRFPLAKHLYSKEKVVRVASNMRIMDVPKLCSSFFRREYIKSLGGWDTECNGYADLALFLKIQNDKKLFTCMEVFGCFQLHADNESHPNRLWSAYPIQSALRLLSSYVDETAPLGSYIRKMVERTYTDALWKSYYTTEERRAYAGELLLSVVQNPRRRFLLKNIWLLNVLGRLYTALRPKLGWLSHIIFKSKYKQVVNLKNACVT